MPKRDKKSNATASNKASVGGASAILPRDIPHGFRNVASTASRLVFVITPGGLEESFLAIAKCSPAPDPPQKDQKIKHQIRTIPGGGIDYELYYFE